MTTWSYFRNPFLLVTSRNYKKALKISTYTYSQLMERQSDGFFGPLFTVYKPLHLALEAAFNTWKTSGGIHKGATLSVEQLFKLLSPGKINAWEYVVMGIYPKGSPQFTAIFPQGHKPFQTGEIEQRISAVAQLALALTGKAPLAATLADVQDFYTQLSDARSGQQGSLGSTGSNSDAVTFAVTAAMTGLYSILGSCIEKYAGNPTQIEPIFDLETIRNHDQLIYTGTLAPDEDEVVVVHTFAPGDEITLSNTGLTEMRFYLSGSEMAESEKTGIILNAGETKTVSVEELGETAGRYLHVYNTNDIAEGHYKVEL